MADCRGARTSRRERRSVLKREKKCSENIRVESEKIIVEQSGASSVVHNDAQQGEYPIEEGI